MTVPSGLHVQTSGPLTHVLAWLDLKTTTKKGQDVLVKVQPHSVLD